MKDSATKGAPRTRTCIMRSHQVGARTTTCDRITTARISSRASTAAHQTISAPGTITNCLPGRTRVLALEKTTGSTASRIRLITSIRTRSKTCGHRSRASIMVTTTKGHSGTMGHNPSSTRSRTPIRTWIASSKNRKSTICQPHSFRTTTKDLGAEEASSPAIGLRRRSRSHRSSKRFWVIDIGANLVEILKPLQILQSSI